MSEHMSLCNHLLIAAPSLDDSTFAHSVIYVCEHHVQGTVGLMINRPMKYPLSLVFEQLNIQPHDAQINRIPLMFGGPQQPERGFVIHRPLGTWQSSLELLPDQVTVTTSNDIIRAIADDKGPKDRLITLGYVAWQEKQLEQEIINDAWLVCPFTPELLYDVPFEHRWEEAGRQMGVNMNQFVFGSGHA
jgi:putative transcriptional regulator